MYEYDFELAPHLVRRKAFISTAFESQGDRTDRYGEVSFLAALDSDPGLHTPHMLHCLADISRSAPRQEDRIDSMASKIHASRTGSTKVL
ncbi:hypothetical protein CC1G_07570 [Coprinopsis cinerea okayama7|uniref:Uncharacterized protein n=1 Tax=Coprinopsis cinerea (strain Okayama-7 / 130 / ATCC MYA-4618 / FGSC 9003) TaxID=240176 RepID=A8NUM4_COPC7|nr:hypothetical protein CC1G_07570 [Coprinopsis cinerea okayama7\|eukprot:XP_001836487.2 hypothetical protein CC1G_07570 [Coprinopsis cinerea okayama7\